MKKLNVFAKITIKKIILCKIIMNYVINIDYELFFSNFLITFKHFTSFN